MENQEQTVSADTEQTTAAPVVNNQATAPEVSEWYSQYPEEMHNYLSKFKSAEDCFKSGYNAASLLGKRLEDLNQNDIEAYGKLMQQMNGTPDSANDYKISIESEENNFLNEKGIELVKQVAYDMKATPDQAQALYKFVNDALEYNASEMEDEYKKEAEYCNQMLQKSWGKAYESKIRAVEACAEKILPQIMGMSEEEVFEILDKSNAQNNAPLMECMRLLGELITEQGSKGYANMAPSDANMTINNMLNDAEFMKQALNTTTAAGREAREKLYRLNRLKHQM